MSAILLALALVAQVVDAPAVDAKGLAAAIPPGWQQLASAEGRFAALMPGKAVRTTQKLDAAGSTHPFVIFTVDRPPSETYFAGYVDFPGEGELDDDLILDGSRDSGVKNVGGKLISGSKVLLDGHPGRQFSYEVEGPNPGRKMHYRSRIYLVERRLFNLLQLRTGGGDASKDAATFFDSFRLLDAAGVAEIPVAPIGKLAGWNEYRPENMHSSIMFPAKPVESERKGEGPGGKYVARTVNVVDGAVLYQFTCAVLGGEVPEPARANFLAALIAGAVAKGKLVSSRGVKLGGVEGVECLYEPKIPGIPAGLPAKARIFVDGRRVYTVLYMELFKGGSERNGDAFLDSLKITAK